MKALIVVGAHYGFRDWLAQRVTAVLMALYTILFLAVVLVQKPAGYLGWFAVFSPAWMKIATLTFIASLLYHAWVGVRDIIMDYVKPTGIRLALQALAGTALVFYLVWSVSILWGR